MQQPESILDILRDAVAAMPVTVEIKDVIDNNTSYTLHVCNPLHAQPGFKTVINGVTYRITEVTPETITVTGSVVPVVGEFELYRPFFYHGTPIATNTELQKERNASNKTPMVWLLRPFKERYHNGGAYERHTTLRLFFLTQADHALWLTDQADDEAIQPMRRLLFHFLNHLATFKDSECQRVFDITNLDYDVTEYAKFGVYLNNNVDKSLFADQLAGVELSAVLPLYRRKHCKKC